MIAREVIDLDKDLSVTLKFEEDECTLSFHVTTKDESVGGWTGGTDPFLWVELLDKKGKPVAVHGTTAIPFSPQSGVQDAPQGTFDVHIFGRGFEPRTYKNVEIKKGRVNTLKIELIPTATVRLQFSNLQDGELLIADISYVALDASGKAIEAGAGGRKTIFQPAGCRPFRPENAPRDFDDDWSDRNRERPGVCQLDFTNVPASCVKMRVTIKGYKVIEFEVKPDLKKPAEIALTLEKE